MNIQCPKCNASIPDRSRQCDRCGASLVPKRIWLGATDKEFSLTAEEDTFPSTEEDSRIEDWRFPLGCESEPLDSTNEEKNDPTTQVRWGGFFRRACAFIVDVAVIALLSAALFALSFIGYKVGLAAHGRSVTWENSRALLVFLAWGWLALATGYFVVYHGMEGKTVGKWLLGLRVVGAGKSTISYRQAFVRWVGTVGFAILALGFLWILWSREKRAWHDHLARTWVIRD